MQDYVAELQTCTDAMQVQVLITDKAGSRLAQVVWEAMRLKCQHLLTHTQSSLLSRPDITDNPALYLIVSFSACNNLFLTCVLKPSFSSS